MAATAIPMTRLGGRAFNYDADDEIEAEYDRLRELARKEGEKKRSCFEQSQEAYKRGEKALAKQLSDEGKAHQRKQADYNRQASELIFRENNAPGRVTDSSIDLHGQYVEEAEAILEARIRQARAEGQTHLHVIVGKGNHSAGHVQKLKPRVEQLCDELGLGYETEENEGRIYVDLTGGKGAGKGKGKANSSSSKPSRPSHGRQDGAGKYQKRPSQQERPRPRPQQPPPEEEKTPDLFDCLKVCCTVM